MIGSSAIATITGPWVVPDLRENPPSWLSLGSQGPPTGARRHRLTSHQRPPDRQSGCRRDKALTHQTSLRTADLLINIETPPENPVEGSYVTTMLITGYISRCARMDGASLRRLGVEHTGRIGED